MQERNLNLRLVHTIPAIREEVSRARREGAVIGLVPTMGALHEGHGELIRRARRECGFVAVSIFVNPIQFDRQDDFERYPKTIESDERFCGMLGVDAIFAPSAAEMYPRPQFAFVEVEGLGDFLCGQFRPGHFRGVATVVAKLFHIVLPDKAYFGEKDGQQLAIVKRMAADLYFPVEIVPVETVRDPDGLAMSSRNRLLTAEERRLAPLLYRALLEAKSAVEEGCTAAAARQRAVEALPPQFRVEYIEVVDPATQEPIEKIDGPITIAAAVWLGTTRLIDNVTASGAGCHPAAGW